MFLDVLLNNKWLIHYLSLCMKFSRYTFQSTHLRLSGQSLGYLPITSGAEGIRTPDPLLARQVLSQLSYNPESGFILTVLFIWFIITNQWA